MVGRAVPTMVWSRAARNMPSIRPLKMIMIWRWVSATTGPPPVRRPGRPLDHRHATGVVVDGVVRITLRCGRRWSSCPLVGVGGVRVAGCGPVEPRSRRCWRPDPRRSSPLARALRSSSVHSAMAWARTRRRDSDTASRTATPCSVRLSRAARPSAGSGVRAMSPAATRSRIWRLMVDRSSSTVPARSDRRSGALFGHQDQQPVAGPADRGAVGQGVPGNVEAEDDPRHLGQRPLEAGGHAGRRSGGRSVGGVDGRCGHVGSGPARSAGTRTVGGGLPIPAI